MQINRKKFVTQAKKRQAKRAQSIEDWQDARVKKIARRQKRKTAKAKARQAGKTARRRAKSKGRRARKAARTRTPTVETGFETVQFEDFDMGGAGAGFDTAAYENGGGAAMTIMDEAWFWPAVAAVAAGVFFLTKKKGTK